MDEQVLRKLSAAAEHERWVADRAGEAVESVGAKLAKAEALVDAARDEAREAADVADAAETRALAAEQAYRDAADNADMTVSAQPATGKAS